MKLSTDVLASLDSRIAVPRYDRELISVGIVHLGVGGFHRAHQAVVIDDLLATGDTSWGICGVGLLPGDANMRDAMRAQDTLYAHVTRGAGGHENVRVIGSIVEYLFAPEDPALVLRRLTDPAVKIVSLTITEGGYLQDHTTGMFDATASAVIADLATPESPTGAFGFIVEAIRLRRERGIAPFTIMSCDNIRSNGDVARRATVGLATLRSPELAEWINHNVAFPNSMVDRITPVTSSADRDLLRENYGVEDVWPVVSEDFFQWVLEDSFSAERPPYEHAGVEIVRDVVPFELMKLRLLNASHQVLAFLGSLAGHRMVHDAAEDEIFARLLRHFWHHEAIPTLQPIPGVDFTLYTESLLERYSNPHIRDTLERLATDASNRIPVFVLPIIRDCLAEGRPVTVGALTVAAWEKYVLGADDNNNELVQHDARADDLRRRAETGQDGPDGFLGDTGIFGKLGTDTSFASQVDQCRTTLELVPTRAAISMLLGEESAQ